jgi:hypothetical protein
MIPLKRSLAWMFAALLFISCGGGDNGTGPGGGNNAPPTPQPTAVGSPDGNPTSQTIGAAGGSVMSEDSVLTLTIPAGALDSDTLITIQPITNNALGGMGKGYRLTPHGLHFTAPVSLAFKVAPENLAGSDPEFLDVAVQDDKGAWYILKNSSYDSGTSTMTATTSHFSDYSNIEGFQIRPASASVSPTGTVDLYVKYCRSEPITDPADNLAGFLYACDDLGDDPVPLGTFSNWSVDGVKGGSATTGRVTALSGSKARYTAPANVPANNPVAVSVEAKSRRGTKTLLISNIKIAGDFFGVITRVTGTGAVNEKAIYTMTWKSTGVAGGYEIFTGSGVLEYTPPDCTTISPTNTPVQNGYMTIDRTQGPPYHATIGIQVSWLAHVCGICGGATTCVDEDYQVGFGDSGIGTVSADGNTISGTFHDNGSGEDWNYSFTR